MWFESIKRWYNKFDVWGRGFNIHIAGFLTRLKVKAFGTQYSGELGGDLSRS